MVMRSEAHKEFQVQLQSNFKTGCAGGRGTIATSKGTLAIMVVWSLILSKRTWQREAKKHCLSRMIPDKFLQVLVFLFYQGVYFVSSDPPPKKEKEDIRKLLVISKKMYVL